MQWEGGVNDGHLNSAEIYRVDFKISFGANSMQALLQVVSCC